MRPSAALEVHREALRVAVVKHHVCNPRIFGSVSRQVDREESDLDLLVDPTSRTTLMDIAALQLAAQEVLGVKVDVLTPNALPPTFRERVLREALPM